MRRKLLLKSLNIIGIALSSLLFCAYLQARRWLYPTSPAIAPQPADSPFQRVSFRAEDGLNIAGWHAPSPSRKTVLMLHGHAGNRDQLLPLAEYLLAAGYGALLVDFRNHGDSEGGVSSMGYHEIKDARAACRFLRAQDDAAEIAIWGHSMGGVVASRLMSEERARGLIIDATFADFPSVVRAGVRERGLPASPITEILLAIFALLSQSNPWSLRPIDHLSALDKPALLIHGRGDPAIPLAQAQRIADANPLIRLSVYEGGHSDLYALQPERYRHETLAYLREIFAGKARLSRRAGLLK